MKITIFTFLVFVSFDITAQSAHETQGMAMIPSGEFIMGKDIQNGLGFSPAHKVKIDSFYLDACEVTNREYLQFCTETGHTLPEFWNTDIFKSGENFPDYPVIGVNWFDAQKYAEWAGKRLPTEAMGICRKGWSDRYGFPQWK